MCNLQDISYKVEQLCELRGYENDKEVISNCWQIINRYLSIEGSSLDVLNCCLQNSLDNGSWILAWKNIREEIDKLSGDYYIRQENEKQEQRKILLDYQPLDLGGKFYLMKNYEN